MTIKPFRVWVLIKEGDRSSCDVVSSLAAATYEASTWNGAPEPVEWEPTTPIDGELERYSCRFWRLLVFDNPIAAMKLIAGTEYIEEAHIAADELLLALARHHGHGEVADIWEQMDKWFA